MFFVREGDILVVIKFDCFVRLVVYFGQILQVLQEKNVYLNILDLSIDMSIVIGKFMLNVIGVVVQFECEMMLECQREGIEKVKLEGKYKGCFFVVRVQVLCIQELEYSGMVKVEIVCCFGIG